MSQALRALLARPGRRAAAAPRGRAASGPSLSPWENESSVRAVAMNRDSEPLAEYEHKMSRAVRTWRHEARDLIFPFTLNLESPLSSLAEISLRPGKYAFSLAPLLGLGLLLPYMVYRKRRFCRAFSPLSALLAASAGLYGLIACFFMEDK